MDLFQELNREGSSILMITHDAGIAARAQRLVEIRDGVLSLPGDEDPAGHEEENELQQEGKMWKDSGHTYEGEGGDPGNEG